MGRRPPNRWGHRATGREVSGPGAPHAIRPGASPRRGGRRPARAVGQTDATPATAPRARAVGRPSAASGPVVRGAGRSRPTFQPSRHGRTS
ncbi:hypothetical protein CA983_05100 [Streptomyces swartbergensis]|uniref:Uncharacterized protein n=1 Tax=Streptomyces swartbergensis TaxID=487165 RepID=A0A243S990_9ACTN|nr:hypothetical protein CA983_05100 [Streptomyces swartbergensis]